jgi:hypothetical protein
MGEEMNSKQSQKMPEGLKPQSPSPAPPPQKRIDWTSLSSLNCINRFLSLMLEDMPNGTALYKSVEAVKESVEAAIWEAVRQIKLEAENQRRDRPVSGAGNGEANE